MSDVAKRLKALNKKIVAIQKLKERGDRHLTEEERMKVLSEPTILRHIEALRSGVDPALLTTIAPPTGEDPPPKEEELPPVAEVPDEACVLTMEPADAEKRVKVLKKKLGQIENLKKKTAANLTQEERDKVMSEKEFWKEATDLEIALLNPPERKQAKVLQGKLEQIEKLKEKNSTDKELVREVNEGPRILRELEALLCARPSYVNHGARVQNGANKPKAQNEKTSKLPPPLHTDVKDQLVVEVAPPAVSYVDDEPLPSWVSDEQMFYVEPRPLEGVRDENDGFVPAKRGKVKSKGKPAHEEVIVAEATTAEEEELAVWQQVVACVELEHAAPPQAVVSHAVSPSVSAPVAVLAGEPVPVLAAAPRPPTAFAVGPATVSTSPPQLLIPEHSDEEIHAPQTQSHRDDESHSQTSERRLKTLEKKFKQIDKLKARGKNYTREEEEKIASEQLILDEIYALQHHMPWPPIPPAEDPLQPEAQPFVPEPAIELTFPAMLPEEAKKRAKVLRKKLVQIDRLRQKDRSTLSTEELEKLDLESTFLAEVRLRDSEVQK